MATTTADAERRGSAVAGPFSFMRGKLPLTVQEQARLASWEPYKSVQSRTGHVTYTRGARAYRRRLDLADADASRTGYMAGFTGAHKGKDPSPLVDADPAQRIKYMEGGRHRRGSWDPPGSGKAVPPESIFRVSEFQGLLLGTPP